MQSLTEEQAAFEQWVQTFHRTKWPNPSPNGQRMTNGMYHNERLHSMWLAWQARAGRPDAEAINAVEQLRDKQAVVLYFETPADREEFVALIREAKPGMIVKNV